MVYKNISVKARKHNPSSPERAGNKIYNLKFLSEPETAGKNIKTMIIFKGLFYALFTYKIIYCRSLNIIFRVLYS